MPSREISTYKEVMASLQSQLNNIDDAPELVAGLDEPLVEQVDEIMD